MLLDNSLVDSLGSLSVESDPYSPSTSNAELFSFRNRDEPLSPSTSYSLSLAWNQGGRNYMEDRHLIHIRRHKDGEIDFMLLGVFDGHGGSSAVDAAIRIFPQQFEYGLLQENENPSCALRMAFWRTNREMFAEFGSWPSNIAGCPSLAGTTATVVLIRDGHIWVANVGDTAAVIALQSDDSSSWYPIGRRATVEHTVSGDEAKRVQSIGGIVKQTDSGNVRVSRVVWSTCDRFCWSKRISCEHPKVQKPLLNMTRSLDKIFGICLHSDGITMRPRKIAELLAKDAHLEEQENIAPTSEDHPQSSLADSILSEYYQSRKGPPPLIGFDNATVLTLKFNSEHGIDVDSLKDAPESGTTIKIPQKAE